MICRHGRFTEDCWECSKSKPIPLTETQMAELFRLRQRVAELEKEAKQLRDLQYELMRSGALVAIEKCKNATGQRRVIDMYVSANQIAEDLLNAMDSGA